MSFFKDNPIRSSKYLAWVRDQPCIICQDRAEPHHLIGLSGGRMGSKECDLMTMPVCRVHHERIHADAGEWFEQYKYIALTLQKAIKDGLFKEIII